MTSMHIRQITLTNYKSYAEADLTLHPKLNCFVGNNGVGKTNFLDAVYYLCMCKSYFSATDQYTIRNAEEFMFLSAELIRDENEELLQCGLHRDKKKQFRRNKKEYERLSDHIGLFPVVMVSPADIQLILGGSEERRKYINSVISQYNKPYLEDIMTYNKVLAQRNRLLKETGNRRGEEELLDIFDDQLTALGEKIHNERQAFIDRFLPVFSKLYNFISNGSENVELVYQSQLNGRNFRELLKENRQKDLAVQFSTCGVHKDDLVLHLEGSPIRKTGSQGQQKTYLVALKLAQFEFFIEEKKLTPLLLLDDVFDKFDAERVRQILKIVGDDTYGQIFITHTNLDRMNNLLKELNIAHKLFFVDQQGAIEELEEHGI